MDDNSNSNDHKDNLTGKEREALWDEVGLKKKSKQLSVAERGEE